jgi:hypothetical protein
MPEQGDNPWLWLSGILAIGIATLFIKYDSRPARSDVERQQARDQERENKLIEANAANAATLKEQSATLLRVLPLVEGAVELHRMGNVKIEENSKVLNELKREVDALRKP